MQIVLFIMWSHVVTPTDVVRSGRALTFAAGYDSTWENWLNCLSHASDTNNMYYHNYMKSEDPADFVMYNFFFKMVYLIFCQFKKNDKS